jgi:hypothetical protein
MDRLKLFVVITISVFLVVVSISSYLAIQFSNLNTNLQNIPGMNLTSSSLSCPTNNTVISFEIDDIDFAPDQTAMLENALYIGNKYNVTFDLAVIANLFDQNMDNDTFSIYQDNQNIFEVVAHGFTHSLDQSLIDQLPVGSYGEFSVFLPNTTGNMGGALGEGGGQPWGNVPYSIQESHIKNMVRIFNDYNLTTATEIFVVPYHTGDINTTLLAAKYGYKLIVQKITSPQTYLSVRFGNIIDTQDYIDIPVKNTFNYNDIINYTYQLDTAMDEGQKRIDITFHPINFQYLSNIDSFISQIIQANPGLTYDELSDRFSC